MPNEIRGPQVADIQIPVHIPQTSLKLGRRKKKLVIHNQKWSISQMYEFAPVLWEDAYKDIHGYIVQVHSF